MLYTIEELAALFKISRSTVYRLKKAQNWPHHLFGTEIRFSLDDIEQIKAMYHKQPAQPETRRSPRVGIRANRNKK